MLKHVKRNFKKHDWSRYPNRNQDTITKQNMTRPIDCTSLLISSTFATISNITGSINIIHWTINWMNDE